MPRDQSYPTTDEEGNPIPPGEIALMKRSDSLYAAYRRKFGEAPPMFSMPTDQLEQLAMVEQAIKSGVPISEDIPEGADA